MTRTEAAEVVAFLHAAFPNAQWSKTTVGLWVEELLAYDVAPAQEAARECFRHCRFMPSMAEFLDHLRQAIPRYVHAEECACQGTGWVEIAKAQPTRRVRHPSHLRAVHVVPCAADARVLASATPAELPPGEPSPDDAARVREIRNWLRQKELSDQAATAPEPERPRDRIRVDETAMPMPKGRRRRRKPKPDKPEENT